jgi:dolichol-phosphate mannosyltransferase
MSETKDVISILIPVYNEEDNIARAYKAVLAVFESLNDSYELDILFTDNNSTDRTFEILRQLAAADPRVRVIRFSRNFGYQKSVLTGYLNARGEAAIQLDCDLQDPVELIPEFLRLWKEGNAVVYGVRRSSQEAWPLNFVRKLFYRLINALSDDHLPLDAGEFRLVDRRVLDELRRVDDATPYLRGLIGAMGFRQVGVPYDRASRQFGYSKFNFGAMLRLAVDGLLNHSLVPLRLASFTGMILAGLTLLGIIVYSVGRFAFGQDWPPGFATTTVLILFSITLNALFLGIIGEYLGRIYIQVKRRPLVIVEDSLNTDTPSTKDLE